MKCQQCKNEITKEQNFCQYCGKENIVKDKFGNFYLIVGILAVLFTTVLFAQMQFVDLNQESKNNSLEIDESYKKTPNITDDMIAEYYSFNSKQYAIPSGYLTKIIDNELVLIPESEEYYCLFSLNIGNYANLRKDLDYLRNYYELKGYSVGKVEILKRAEIEWITIELTEKENNFLIAHSYISDEKYITILINKDSKTFEYDALETLIPFVAHERLGTK